MRVAKHVAWNAVRNRTPRLTVIAGLVNKRLAVVHLMEINRDVSGAGVVTRRFNVADRAPCGQIWNVLRYVCPALAVVARQLNEAIIRASTDQALLFRRLGNRENDWRVFDADIVASQSTGKALPAFV